MSDQAPLRDLARYFESRDSSPTPTDSETPPLLLSNEAASFSTPSVNTTALWAPNISLRLTRIEDLLLKLSGTVSEHDIENKELLRQNQQQQAELRTAVSDLNARITANDELLQGIQQQQKEQHTAALANPTENNQLLQQIHQQLLSAAADERDVQTKAEAAFNSKRTASFLLALAVSALTPVQFQKSRAISPQLPRSWSHKHRNWSLWPVASSPCLKPPSVRVQARSLLCIGYRKKPRSCRR